MKLRHVRPTVPQRSRNGAISSHSSFRQSLAFRTDTGLVVKRLRRDGGAWTMVSDADDWAPRPVTGQDRIVGHVVWFGPEGVIVTEE